MAGERRLIVKVARMITDCMDAKLGLVKMDSSRPEYQMLDKLLTDEMAELILKMGRRKPTTAAELSEKLMWEEERVQRLLDELSEIGIVEYNRHNPDRHKQYVVPVFVVGSCENLVLNKKLRTEHPEVAEFFYQMGYLPLKMISHMVPPGGSGLGFHTVPVEKAIPKESSSLSIEKLSYWLKKYEKQLAICDCCCRTAMIMRNEGCGELPYKGCIALGDYADYLIETDRAERATLDEVLALLQRSEDNGFMHQVTNGDGGDDIFAICNCSVGNCFALRCSQLFNNQNASASAYRAVVDRSKCAACGKCVEVCPTGAARLGQKLCTSAGPVKYEHEPQPGNTKGWSEANWHPDYRDRNMINCYDSGTSPCKAVCPAHVSVQGVLELVRQERYLDALKLLRMDNPFPSACEKCLRNCEKVCMRNAVDSPMEIVETIKRLAALQGELADELVPKKVRLKGEDKDYDMPIAVRGTGYAQLSCAYFLALTGYPVTVFGTKPECSDAELYILKKLGVTFVAGEPDAERFTAVYPDIFPYADGSPAKLIEAGHEAATSIHRHIHPGHKQDLARNMRDFKSIKRRDIFLPIDSAKEHRCLSCGVTYVDPNRCIGCGICMTRCMFDAIKLQRSNPEYVNYCTVDSAVGNVMLNGIKRAGRIAISELKRAVD